MHGFIGLANDLTNVYWKINNPVQHKTCTAMERTNRHWYSIDCSEEGNWVCKVERCPKTWTLQGDVCRKKFNKDRTWREANQFCQSEYGATLPIFKNAEDMANLKEYRNEISLGYSDKGHKDTFTEITCDGEKLPQYLDGWATNQQTDQNQDSSVTMCQIDACPNNFMYFQHSCYYHHDNELNYHNAMEVCRQLDSSLLVINTQEELNTLMPYLKNNYFIGYHRRNVKEFYEMDIGHSPWSALNISTMDGDEAFDCVVFNGSSLKRSSCDSKVHFICERAYMITPVQHHTSEIFDPPLNVHCSVLYSEKSVTCYKDEDSNVYISSLLSLTSYTSDKAEISSSETNFPNMNVKTNSQNTMVTIEMTSEEPVGVFQIRIELNGVSTTVQWMVLKATANVKVEPSQRSVTVGLGETVTLTVIASTANNLRWRHNNKLIYSDSSHDVKNLTIVNARREDEGVYECYYQGERHFRMHHFIYLYVTECPTSYCGIPSCALNCPICYNGGRCHARSCTCVCPPGFSGTHCENDPCSMFDGWETGFEGSCYRFVTSSTPITWKDARLECMKVENGDLALIKTEAEIEYIQRRTNTTNKYWIGCFCEAFNGNCHWLDCSPPSFSVDKANFKKCGYFVSKDQYHFGYDFCFVKHMQYVCEISAFPTSVIPSCSSGCPYCHGGHCDVSYCTCVCPAGFSGAHCEPYCYNGGNSYGSCTCSCPPGYSGTRCENVDTECGSEDCSSSNAGDLHETLISLLSPIGFVCPSGLKGYKCTESKYHVVFIEIF
ncbi:uncharacterized protein [Antedon mediterranea]|uniref:uncharacterized protein n=1 Tax=Antedon mediterranea TaxID=105859 RepID=UPI003AF42BD7